MNLELLAKLAGVSVSTVSKAFSDSDEISDVTKRRTVPFFQCSIERYEKTTGL